MNASYWTSPYSTAALAIGGTTVGALSIITILGNALVVLAYHLDTSIRKQMSNRYIISLAVSDMVIGLEGLPMFSIYLATGERWPLGAFLCETWLFLDYTLCLVSILTVLLITVDRYMSVCHAAAYIKWQSIGRINVLLALSWVVPTVFFGFVIYAWYTVTGESIEEGTCSAPFLNNQWVNMAMYFSYYWSTLLAMLILYTGIHKASKKLQVRGEAREKRTIALMMGQRLGAQVGLRMFMAEDKAPEHEPPPSRSHTPRPVHTSFRRFIKHNVASAFSTPIKVRADIYVEHEKVMPGEVTTSGYQTCSDALAVLPRSPSAMQANIADAEEEDSADDTIYELSRTQAADASLHRAHDADDATSYTSMELYVLHDVLSCSSQFADVNLSSVLNIDSTLIRCADGGGNSLTSGSKQSSILWHRHSSARVHHPSPYARHLGRHGPLAHTSSTPSRPRLTRDNTNTTVDVSEEHSTTSPITVLRVEVALAPEIAHGDNDIISVKLPSTSLIRKDKDSDSEGDEARKLKVLTAKHKRPSFNVRIAQKVRRSLRGGSLSSTESMPVEDSQRNTAPRDDDGKQLTFVQSIMNPVALFRKRKKTRAERRARKAFRTITFIVGFFAALWSPYFIAATIYGFCAPCVPPWLFNICYYLCYINSTGNPFMYALANRQFKVAFLRILKGDFRKL